MPILLFIQRQKDVKIIAFSLLFLFFVTLTRVVDLGTFGFSFLYFCLFLNITLAPSLPVWLSVFPLHDLTVMQVKMKNMVDTLPSTPPPSPVY